MGSTAADHGHDERHRTCRCGVRLMTTERTLAACLVRRRAVRARSWPCRWLALRLPLTIAFGAEADRTAHTYNGRYGVNETRLEPGPPIWAADFRKAHRRCRRTPWAKEPWEQREHRRRPSWDSQILQVTRVHRATGGGDTRSPPVRQPSIR